MSGRDGQPGAPGDSGLPGNSGPVGRLGLPGRSGCNTIRIQRRKGVKGAPGAPGDPGLIGVSGRDGVPGTVGVTGLPGRPGLPGIPGVPGASGRPGSAGAPGNDAIYCPCPSRSKIPSPLEVQRLNELRLQPAIMFHKNAEIVADSFDNGGKNPIIGQPPSQRPPEVTVLRHQDETTATISTAIVVQNPSSVVNLFDGKADAKDLTNFSGLETTTTHVRRFFSRKPQFTETNVDFSTQRQLRKAKKQKKFRRVLLL